MWASSSSSFSASSVQQQQRHFASKRNQREQKENKSVGSRRSPRNKLRDDNDDCDSNVDSNVDDNNDTRRDDDNDDDDSSKRVHRRKQRPHHDLEPETQHIGIVHKITSFGAVVQLACCPVLGSLHISEMSDDYMTAAEAKDFVKVGEKIQVVVLENEYQGDPRIRLSMRSDAPVAPALPDNFHPVTVVAHDVPVDVNYDTLEDIFGRYGKVISIDELPMEDEEEATRRPITKITFLHQEAADACLKEKRVRIPYDIDNDKTRHASVRVRLSKKQDYREELLRQMYVKYLVQKEVREERKTDPRILRNTDRSLRDCIPYYDDWKRSERDIREAILNHDPLSKILSGR